MPNQDLKLKKEENLELLKKLSKEKVDTSLFQSSKKLGRGHESKRERLGRAMRERRAGLDREENEDILLESRPYIEDIEEEIDNEEDLDLSGGLHDTPALPAISTPTTVTPGTGLKRPLETDETGNPIIKKRKRMKPKPKGWTVTNVPTPTDSDWEGFSSENDDGGSASSAISDEGQDSDEESPAAEDNSDEGLVSDSVDDDDNSDDDEDAETSEEENVIDSGKAEQLKERSLAFKEWATQQRNHALGFVPSRPVDLLSTSKTDAELKAASRASQVSAITESSNSNSVTNGASLSAATADIPPSTLRKVFNVTVTRTDDIQEARLALPVVAEEQKIMEVIHNNDIVVVWGATGSGKTTQVPQFLFEAGYGNSESPTPGMIAVTQPRRVAAVSMAKRVATELSDFKDRVAYQIRFDSTVSKETAIKFMTDGVLLREISKDFTLSKYSAIVLDEAHERSINTDLLIGMLSRIVETRADLAKTTEKYKPLKLVIMSATLRTADLTMNKTLFRKGQPPVVQAEGRQYPVSVHFARRTNRDYLDEAFAKVSRGHKKLPQGGILVFLTGQNEIITLAKRLKQAFASTDGPMKAHAQVRISAADGRLKGS